VKTKPNPRYEPRTKQHLQGDYLLFGRFKGERLQDTPTWYLNHVLDFDDLSARDLAKIKMVLLNRGSDHTDSQDKYQAPPQFNTAPNLPAGVHAETILEIVKAGYRQLAKTHHPDQGGDDEAMKRINVAKDFLESRFNSLTSGAERPRSTGGTR
jgi:hypothetical protein